MMVLSHAALTPKTPLLRRVYCFSRRPSSLFSRSKIPIAPIQISGFRDLSCNLYSKLSSSGHEVFKELGLSKLGISRLGCDKLRLSALSDTGAGGNGGDRDSGDRGEGGGSDDRGDGREKWSLLSWYLALLAKYPVLIKALTSAILTLIGDLLCQLLIDQVSSLDLKRTSVFTLLGFVLVGPTLHFWYLYLSKLVTVPGASGALLRLLLDQFLFSPIFIGVFLATLVALEGKPSHVVPKLQQEWFSAVLASWQLWVPFQFLNFRFVPQQFQVLAANAIALVWNVILSFKAHKEVVTK